MWEASPPCSSLPRLTGSDAGVGYKWRQVSVILVFAPATGTTERDTREDFIMLSERLKWSVSLRGYDLKVRPRGLKTCRHMVLFTLLQCLRQNA
jgi:hypothetical protein